MIDAGGRLLGIAREPPLQHAQDAGEGWLSVGSVLEPEEAGSCRVDEDRPITEVLSSETLGRLGALMAVDGEGVLRGVVTLGQVRRALQSAFGSPSQLVGRVRPPAGPAPDPLACTRVRVFPGSGVRGDA